MRIGVNLNPNFVVNVTSENCWANELLNYVIYCIGLQKFDTVTVILLHSSYGEYQKTIIFYFYSSRRILNYVMLIRIVTFSL